MVTNLSVVVVPEDAHPRVERGGGVRLLGQVDLDGLLLGAHDLAQDRGREHRDDVAGGHEAFEEHVVLERERVSPENHNREGTLVWVKQ